MNQDCEKKLDEIETAICVNCGKDGLIDSLLIRELIATGPAGYQHMDGAWLCEKCENRMTRLKAEVSSAFGLAILKQKYKNGRIVRGWDDE